MKTDLFQRVIVSFPLSSTPDLTLLEGALPTEQLGCVLQVVEWGTPGMLHIGVISKT